MSKLIKLFAVIGLAAMVSACLGGVGGFGAGGEEEISGEIIGGKL